MNDSLAPLMESAVAAARTAGAIQLRRPRAALQVEEKGAADITTDVDRDCERAIAELVRERHPDHALLAEEGTSSAGSSPHSWIVDPLDGTKNYAHGFTRSCVSVAISRAGTVVVGVVFNSHTDELFSAALGDGARLNGAPIRVSATPTLGRAMVASALTYDQAPGVRRADRVQLERLARVLGVAEAVRSDGCCALDLCDVARGRYDAYFESGSLKAWDTAAGALIVREAGGRVSTFGGAPHDPFGPETLASNGLVHDELVRLMPA
jgi:myo-inositol-1(or 4)-monophosphatase